MANQIVRSFCLEFTPKLRFRPCSSGEMFMARKKGFNGMAYPANQALGAGSTKTMIVEYDNRTRFILKQVFKMGKCHGHWETINRVETKDHIPASKYAKQTRKKNIESIPENLFG